MGSPKRTRQGLRPLEEKLGRVCERPLPALQREAKLADNLFHDRRCRLPSIRDLWLSWIPRRRRTRTGRAVEASTQKRTVAFDKAAPTLRLEIRYVSKFSRARARVHPHRET